MAQPATAKPPAIPSNNGHLTEGAISTFPPSRFFARSSSVGKLAHEAIAEAAAAIQEAGLVRKLEKKLEIFKTQHQQMTLEIQDLQKQQKELLDQYTAFLRDFQTATAELKELKDQDINPDLQQQSRLTTLRKQIDSLTSPIDSIAAKIAEKKEELHFYGERVADTEFKIEQASIAQENLPQT